MKVLFNSLLIIVIMGCGDLKEEINTKEKIKREIIGTWDIADRIILIKTDLTELEQNEFNADYQKCLKSFAHIDTNCIFIGNNLCEFDTCKSSLMKNKIITLPVINDTEDTKKYPGQEIIDNNVVGKTFLNLLDKEYSSDSLSFIVSDCKVSWGDNTLRICLINKQKIALFSGGDLIILTRLIETK